MSRGLLVLKLGGDALATPAHIASAAAEVAGRRQRHELVVVTSARRGVTDRLMSLASEVDRASRGWDAPDERQLLAERAVAAGELVTAALLAAALARLGVPAVSCDAREAGLRGSGPPGRARLVSIRTARLRRHLARGELPVVAGFQCRDRGMVRTLGRGGSDITAVALAAALMADACVLLKRAGLRIADPQRFPAAPHAGSVDFARLHAILEAGGQVLHPEAARLAERYGIPLVFVPFPDEGPASTVQPEPRERSA